MSKIMRSKTPFEFCAYPVLKEALETMNYIIWREHRAKGGVQRMK